MIVLEGVQVTVFETCLPAWVGVFSDGAGYPEFKTVIAEYLMAQQRRIFL